MNESELTQAAVTGDTLALQRLLLANYEALTAYIAPRIPPPLRRTIDAEDVVQEAFQCVYRDITSHFVPRGEGSFLAWARSITEKRLIDKINAESRQKRGGNLQRRSAGIQFGSVADFLGLQPDKVLTPSRNVAGREAVEFLREAIARLPSIQREAVQLSLEGKTPDAIAAAMGRTKGAIRGLLHRAKIQLKEELGTSGKWFTRGGKS